MAGDLFSDYHVVWIDTDHKGSRRSIRATPRSSFSPLTLADGAFFRRRIMTSLPMGWITELPVTRPRATALRMLPGKPEPGNLARCLQLNLASKPQCLGHSAPPSHEQVQRLSGTDLVDLRLFCSSSRRQVSRIVPRGRQSSATSTIIGDASISSDLPRADFTVILGGFLARCSPPLPEVPASRNSVA